MENFIKSILDTLQLGVKITLSNGSSFRFNLKNEIIYESKEIKKIISKQELSDIINNIKFWVTEDGRYIDMNYMSTSHIENTISHLERKSRRFTTSYIKDSIDISIGDLRTVLRDRNINNILEEENFGLDNLT